jgi:hypothetical protein
MHMSVKSKGKVKKQLQEGIQRIPIAISLQLICEVHVMYCHQFDNGICSYIFSSEITRVNWTKPGRIVHCINSFFDFPCIWNFNMAATPYCCKIDSPLWQSVSLNKHYVLKLISDQWKIFSGCSGFFFPLIKLEAHLSLYFSRGYSYTVSSLQWQPCWNSRCKGNQKNCWCNEQFYLST